MPTMVWGRLTSVGVVAVAALLAVSGQGQAKQLAFTPQHFELLGGLPGSDGIASFNAPADDLFAPDETLHEARLATRVVPFDRNLAPGSIVVKTSERKLYFVLPNKQAMLYPVGVGREGFTWSGRNHISRKAEWPDWRPPKVMIAREAKKGHHLPDVMEGGPKNPLGARALYIGSTEFRIHGTTQPWSIGRAVSSGCIRMLNAHVIDLFDRVSVGAVVVVER